MSVDYAPISSFKKIIQTYYQTCSSKWTGLTGAEHIPSVGECERFLIESNCFIFSGTERFLSYFNSTKISSLNLNGIILLKKI